MLTKKEKEIIKYFMKKDQKEALINNIANDLKKDEIDRKKLHVIIIADEIEKIFDETYECKKTIKEVLK